MHAVLKYCRPANILPQRLLSGSMLICILLIVTSWPVKTLGQKRNYFTVDGRRINIKSFNSEVNKMMDDVGVPGVSLAIMENGKIAFFNAYGHRRATKNRKVTRRTIFEACSLSKTFLVYVVYQLVDEGKFDLDKPMYQYLKYEPLEHDPRYKQITPRMILSHCSGIENWRMFNNPDVLEILNNPGEKFEYSGEGYQYLAKVVDMILQEPYRKYIYKRVIKPLHLKRAFTSYKFNGRFPTNYAVGHWNLGGEVEKWKNLNTLPAGGNHVTAEDYAKLTLAFFDKTKISGARIKDILQPVTKLKVNDDGSSVYYGPGFVVIYNKNDTIIAHGGSNGGFKAQMFYSVVSKKGYIFLTNSDRGKAMASQLSKMSVGLDVSPYYKQEFYEQYPSKAITLLKTYKEKKSEAMFEEIEKLKSVRQLDSNTLNELGDVFLHVDNETSKKLLTESISLFPASPTAYSLIGRLYMDLKDYDQAYANLRKAKELGIDFADIEHDVKECEKKLNEPVLRGSYNVNIAAGEESTIQAENYNLMGGVEVGQTGDEGGGQDVGYIDTGDWMDYNVTISKAGMYTVAFRVASLPGGGKLELREGTSVLAAVGIATTKGWQKWTTLRIMTHLPEGHHTFKLFAATGGFNINWLKISPKS